MMKTKVKRVSAALSTMSKQGRSLEFIAKAFAKAATQAKQYGRTDYEIGVLAWRTGGGRLVKALNRLGVCPTNPFLLFGRGTQLIPGKLCTPESIREAIGPNFAFSS